MSREDRSPRTSLQVKLPSEWDVRLLGELFAVQQGKAVSKAARQGPSPQPFLRTSNVLWGRLVTSHLDEMSFDERETERLSLVEGDLLVCEGGEIGRTAIWNGEVPECLYQNHIHRLRARDDSVDPLFAMYWLQAGVLQLGLVSGVGNRTTIPNLSASRLRQLPVVLPPPAEQRAISAALGTLQSAYEFQAQQVACLRELKAATLAKVFRDGPDATPSTGMRETPYGLVPAAWSEQPLAECADIQTGVTKGRAVRGHRIDVPYLRVANVQDGYLDMTEVKTIELAAHELDRYALRAGDVVLTEGGDFDKLGRGALWRGEVSPCVHQNHIFAVRPDRTRLLPEYLAYLVQSPYGKAYFLSVAHKTTNLASINVTKLGRFPVPLPPLSEQRRIAEIAAGLDQELEHARRRAGAHDALFRATLPLLVMGSKRIV